MLNQYLGSYNDGENLIIRIIESENLRGAAILFDTHIRESQGWDEIEREYFRVLPLDRIQKIK